MRTAISSPMARYDIPTVVAYGDSLAARDPELTQTLQSFLDGADVSDAGIRTADPELMISRGDCIVSQAIHVKAVCKGRC